MTSIEQSEPDALLKACKAGNEELALELLNGTNCELDYVDDHGNTALMVACDYDLAEVALELLKIGTLCKPDHVNNYGITALIYACNISYGLETVAVEIVKSGNSKPDHVDDHGSTALDIACLYKLENVALELLKVGTLCKPDHVNYYGSTPLINACKNSLETVAVEIVKFGTLCNPDHVDVRGKTALSYAKMKNLHLVIEAIENRIWEQPVEYEDSSDNILEITI